MAWNNMNGLTKAQGRYYQGRTPLHTFLEGLQFYQKYVYEDIDGKEAV